MHQVLSDEEVGHLSSGKRGAVASSQRREIGVSDQRCSDRRNDAIYDSDINLETASLRGAQNEECEESVESRVRLRAEGADVLNTRLRVRKVQIVSKLRREMAVCSAGVEHDDGSA